MNNSYNVVVFKRVNEVTMDPDVNSSVTVARVHVIPSLENVCAQLDELETIVRNVSRIWTFKDKVYVQFIVYGVLILFVILFDI